MVVDGDPDGSVGRIVIGYEHRNVEVGAGMKSSVVDEVRDHVCQTASVAANHGRLGVGRHSNGRPWRTAHGHGVPHELGDGKVFHMKANGTGIETGDLEQVLDEPLESRDIGHEKIESGLGAIGHLVVS